MKIAAHVGVKDEIELIGPCIAHLRSIGVTEFIICEMGSTDGTAEFVAGQESDDFRVLKLTNQMPGEDWHDENAKAVRACQADWIVFADADEFILPASGSLAAEFELAQHDVVRIPRYNVPLGVDGPFMPLPLTVDGYRHVDLIVEPMPDFRTATERDSSLPWIRAIPMPKVAARPGCIRRLTDGMHDVIPEPGVSLTSMETRRIVTAHLPVTTEARLLRKIENIREVCRYHDSYNSGQNGWHWRRWLDLVDRGEIGAEFQRSRFSPETMAILKSQGIVRDAATLLGIAQRDR